MNCEFLQIIQCGLELLIEFYFYKLLIASTQLGICYFPFYFRNRLADKRLNLAEDTVLVIFRLWNMLWYRDFGYYSEDNVSKIPF